MAQATAPILDSADADIQECPPNVGYCGQSGQNLLNLSFTEIDPSATSCVQICCGAQGGFSLSGVVG
jgi:hypothetical protein